MEATGIIRKADHEGRLVLPVELRQTLGIGPGDSLTFSVDYDRIVLHKHEPGCVFCRSTKGEITYAGKIVCLKCLAMIAAKLDA